MAEAYHQVLTKWRKMTILLNSLAIDLSNRKEQKTRDSTCETSVDTSLRARLG